MTEQEFLTQVWRVHDKITTVDNVKGKVLGVSFTTKSVRAFISGAPEWVKYDLIKTHTTGNDEGADEEALIDKLREKVIQADRRIHNLELEREKLIEKASESRYSDILRAINIIKQGLVEKKNKIEKIDNGLNKIEEILEKKL